MVMRVGKFVFWGLLMGYLVAMFLSRWMWLEMRANTSLIILTLTLLGGIWGFFKKPHWHKGWFFGTEILLLIVFFVIYQDLSALTVIPAIKFKEAFFMSFLSLSQANIILFLLLVVGNILWCIPHNQGGNLIEQSKK